MAHILYILKSETKRQGFTDDEAETFCQANSPYAGACDKMILLSITDTPVMVKPAVFERSGEYSTVVVSFDGFTRGAMNDDELVEVLRPSVKGRGGARQKR